jgi:hypothetical protein
MKKQNRKKKAAKKKVRKKPRPRKDLREVMPFTLEIPLRPLLEPKPARKRGGQEHLMTHESGDLCIADADRNRVDISEHYRERYSRGDLSALDELLEISPRFIREPWVRAAFEEEIQAGSFGKNRRGRPRRSSPESIAVRLRIVCVAKELHREKGMSMEQVFRDISARGIVHLSYDRIKEIYYESLNDSRLKPLLMPSWDGRHFESEPE